VLLPGAQRLIKLNHRFDGPHQAARIQIEVLTPTSNVELGITAVQLCESLASVEKRLSAEQLTLSYANRLFRDGDYTTAMCIYLLVGDKVPLRLFSDNAMACARRLGLATVRDADELKVMLA
jgi:hypothetical protein